MNFDKFSYTKSYRGKSRMCSGNYYMIYLSYNGHRVVFGFHDNYKNDSDLKDWLYCLLLDKQAYENNRTIYDFMSEFGYRDYCEAKRIYEACGRNARKINKLFTCIEVCELEKELENY